jgi:hypothetical protein
VVLYILSSRKQKLGVETEDEIGVFLFLFANVCLIHPNYFLFSTANHTEMASRGKANSIIMKIFVNRSSEKQIVLDMKRTSEMKKENMKKKSAV